MTELNDAWHQLEDIFYEQATQGNGKSDRALDLAGLCAINNAEVRFANALRDLWPQFRQGRVGPPEAAEPPIVRRQRGVKITLTLEDLDL